ncbi:MAG: mandelate racemase/muconate lactonizing enzyme family protein [Acidobacteria bacterium]|nr:mandelate racemase/muconate lactonizing enzyme family protein [Acidobacteriota bacterium]
MSHPTNDDMGRPSRRRFLRGICGFAALAASFGASRGAAGSPRPGGARPAPGGAAVEMQGPRITVREVNAYPIYINQRSEGLLDPPVFDGDDDPRRWRWGGPFEQLPSAIIAVIKTDQGIVGFGMGAGGTAAVEIIRGHLRHLLIGTSPLDVEQRWDQMYSSGLLYGRRGLFPMALSAVDNALWDIAGKYADRPVTQMIGGWPRERLALYQTGGNIPQALARGVRNFKIGTPVGPHTPPDEQNRVVERVLAARDTIGPDANLMIDCVSRNGTADWAVGYAQQLRPANLYFMEELLSPDDVFGYAELVRRIGGGGPGWTRVACGEHEYTEHGFDVLVRNQAAEILQPDITWCGGLTAGKRIRDLVEGAGLELIPHRGGSVWGLPIALTARTCTMAESFPAQSPILDAMSPPFDNGDYVAPTTPGFGSTLTEQMVLDARLPGTF